MDLRFMVMKMLSKSEMNGYSLRKNISAFINKELSSGALYPALKNLESGHLITVNNEVKGGRFKKVYSLTEKGKINLKEEEALLKKLIDIDRSGIKLEIVEDDG